MQGITQVKRRLKRFLLERLPAKLTAIDLEEVDGIDTPPPYRVHTSERRSLDGYPAIELVGTGSDGNPDTVAQIYVHRVVVSCTLAGDDEERLAAEVERYVYAIRQLCRDTLMAPDVDTGPIDTGSETYTPLRPQEGLEVPFVKGGFIELFIKTVE